jgi:hypothetical protein
MADPKMTFLQGVTFLAKVLVRLALVAAAVDSVLLRVLFS